MGRWSQTQPFAPREARDLTARRPVLSADRFHYFCRDPMVEVRGVEPRSVEPSTPASPSAAISERFGFGTLMARDPSTYSELSWPVVPKPTRASCITAPGSGEAGTPRADGLLLGLNQAASAKLSSALIFLSRFFNEDSGDLGSLPALRHSTSKPVHPRVFTGEPS